MASQTDTHHAEGTSSETQTESGVEHALTPGKNLHTQTQTHGGAHEDVGFPPFNPDTFAPQLIWLALTFGSLYLLMSRVALPRIGEIIEERDDRINRDLETAQRLKKETEKALGAYEQALKDARGNASEIARETREQLAQEVDIERKRVDAEINAKVSEAEASIKETQEKALASVNEIAGDVAGSLVSKLTGGKASSEELEAALNAAPSRA